jgi:ribosomal protein S18 acetylase RimI-like enzyme
MIHRAPGNITLKPLSEENAEIVDDEWPNKHIGSLFFVKRLIAWNQNIGAFNEEGELMGWCLRLQAGPLGALQVREKFMRRGIGSLVTIAMCKILANEGLDTFALVGTQNIASQTMFSRLGFERKDDAYWLRTLPLDEKFEWSD